MVAFWSNQLVLVPYAPDSGAFLQEPDTHEHAQIKADIRYVKNETQFDLEQEATQKNKKESKVKFGPRDCLHVCTKGIEMFKIRNPLVPIQGVIQNHILAVRPTKVDGTIQIKLLEDCAVLYISININ